MSNILWIKTGEKISDQDVVFAECTDLEIALSGKVNSDETFIPGTDYTFKINPDSGDVKIKEDE